MDESNSWTLPGHDNYCLVFARQGHKCSTTVPNTRHLLVDLDWGGVYEHTLV